MKLTQLRSQSGSTLLLALGFAAFVALVSVSIVELSGKSVLYRQSEFSQLEAQYANERGLTMAGYLIANNLIICKNSTNDGQKCEWGGQYHSPRALSERSFSLSTARVDSEGVLELTFDPPSTNAGFRTPPTILRFQLSNFGKDINSNSRALDLIGQLPNESAIVDDDWWIVLVEAKSTYRDSNGEPKELLTIGGIRRPVATPILDVAGSPMCQFSCKASDTVSPNPDCKGPQVVLPDHREVLMDLVVLNLGPGAALSATYQRSVTYNPQYYPAMTAPVISGVDVVQANEPPLMPLQRKIFRDKFICESPQIFQSAANEADNQQFMSLFSYSYTISVPRFDMNDLSYRRNPANFMAQYDPFNRNTFKPNPTISRLEPKKAGGTLAPLDSNLVRLPPITPTPTPVTTWGGDGDGGGGGN